MWDWCLVPPVFFRLCHLKATCEFSALWALGWPGWNEEALLPGPHEGEVMVGIVESSLGREDGCQSYFYSLL